MSNNNKLEDKKKLSLTARIVIGMVAGMLLGGFLNLVFPDNAFVEAYLSQGLFYVIGEIFIASLQMLVVPLVFVSLVLGTCSLSDPAKLGRLGGKTVGLYMLTTALAIAFAVFMAVIFEPGVGLDLATDKTYQPG